MILKCTVTPAGSATVRVSLSRLRTRLEELRTMRKRNPLDALVRPAEPLPARVKRSGAGIHRKTRKDRANTERRAVQEATAAWR
jgi:hypothetical protein